MTEDQAPPTPLPPAAQPPYPAHPEPHAHDQVEPHPIPQAPAEPAPIEGAGIGPLGMTMIGGAVAAAVGLLVAIPLFRRRKAKTGNSKTAPATRRRKRSN